MRSTNTAKKRCLDEIQKIIKAEEAKELGDQSAAPSIEKIIAASQAIEEERDMLMRPSRSEVESNTGTETVSKSTVKAGEEEDIKKEEEEKKEEKPEPETNFNANSGKNY